MIPNAWTYDPRTDAWTAAPAMPVPRHGLAGVTVKGRFYAVGGGLQESGRQASAMTEVLLPT